MRLLLDTHVLLWSFADQRRLSAALLQALKSRPELFASAASLWEIAIKRSKGRLEAPDDLPSIIRRAGFRVIEISVDHAWSVRHPPPSLQTADPFDRMIYAQALKEGLTLATRDRALLASGLPVVPA